MSSFSNFGKSVDLLAPGEYVQSTIPSGKEGWMSGTSMASPISAGVMGLIVSRNPFQKDVWKLKQIMIGGCLHNWVRGMRPYTSNLLVNTRDSSICRVNKFIYQ